MSGSSEKKPSIYKIIKEALLEDGSLPKGFGLHVNHIEWYLCYVDGAQDSRMHYQPSLVEKQPFWPVKSIIKSVRRGRIKGAAAKADKYFQKYKCFPIMGVFRQWINGQTMYLRNVLNFCWHLITQSEQVESVKFGLVFLEALDTGEHPELVKVIKCLAVCEEFTSYCLYLYAQWENSNEEVFCLAKKLKSWGKIYALKMLKPDSEEIRRWIITDGCKASLSPSFFALDCVRKIDVSKYMEKGEISGEEAEGLELILKGLLDESQLKGISLYPDPVPLFDAYLRCSSERMPSAEGFDIIAQIAERLKESTVDSQGGGTGALVMAEELLKQPLAVEIIRKGIYRGAGFSAAAYLEIDFDEEAFERMEEDFEQYFYLSRYLMLKKKMAGECIALFEERLPLEEMKEGLGGAWYVERNYRLYQKLNFILSLIALYPGKGLKLMECALEAPAAASRKIALSVLQIWLAGEEGALRNTYPGLYLTVRRAFLREKKNENRKLMVSLLFGSFFH